MKNKLLLLFFFCASLSFAQINFERVSDEFDLPKGVLESVAYANTRMYHLQGDAQSCVGLPQYLSIMGLVEDGKDYFNNNLITVSEMSGISVESIKAFPDSSIRAYGKSLQIVLDGNSDWNSIFQGIGQLSELPDESLGQQFAKEAFLYQVFLFLTDKEMHKKYGFADYGLNGNEIFGSNFKLHSSKKVVVKSSEISSDGNQFVESNFKNTTCNDYANSLFVAADPSNYSSRNGVAISAITIHDIEGSYSGAISWFQNPSANVSAHYVLRSSDGQITQMVCEEDKGWHVGTGNPYSIGFEHEGYASQPGWYTEEMYQASADLVRDICNSGYGINPLRTYNGPECLGSSSQCELGGCIRIKGHQHYPSQTHTDPGIYWDWPYFYQLINQGTAVNDFTTESGIIVDSGGENGNYSDDERMFYKIEVPLMETVSLNFEQFELENDWDFLKVYLGTDEFAPLVRTYTGNQIPNDTTFETDALFIEFTSDCATNLQGYKINYSTTLKDIEPPTTTIDFADDFYANSFQAQFTDTDLASDIAHSFVNVSYRDEYFISNDSLGMLFERFEDLNAWQTPSGTWSVSNGELTQSTNVENNTNAYAKLNQNEFDAYLHEFDFQFAGAGGNQRLGYHFMSDSAQYLNRLNSYFIWYRLNDAKFQLYKVTNDVFDLVQDVPMNLNADEWYHSKIVYSKEDSTIYTFLNDSLINSWRDTLPYQIGNYVSFRTGNSEAKFRNLTCYHSRGADFTVEVGTDNANHIRKQSSLSLPNVGLVSSYTFDEEMNVSNLAQKNVKVDWTKPILYQPTEQNVVDEDTSYDANNLSIHWQTPVDTNSGVQETKIQIGSVSNPTFVQDWMVVSGNSLQLNNLNLELDTTYFVKLVAVNGANLSDTITSDGILILENLGIENHLVESFDIYPNPSSDLIQFNIPFKSGFLFDSQGKLIRKINSGITHLDIRSLASGKYLLMLKSDSKVYQSSFIKK